MLKRLFDAFCLKFLPKAVFARLYCTFYNRDTKIEKRDDGWLITRGGMEMLSPTPKYLFPGLSHFEGKLERHFKIEPGDTAVDVGACYGDTTVPMAMKVGETGRVIGVEASPVNAKYLRLNLGKFPNAEVVEKAVSNKTGDISFWLHFAPTGGSIEHAHGRNQEVKVQADTLDNILKDIKVDFLKIDVQGTEAEAIEGAREVIARTPKVVIETHYRTTAQRTYPKVLEMMKQFKHTIHFDPADGIVYAVNETG